MAAVAAALVVAEAAVLAFAPRDGVITPLPVDVASYFSEAQLDRARDFRRPQALLYGVGLAIQALVLVLALRRPPRRLMERLEARPVLGSAGLGALLAVALAVATLPVSAIARSRALDVGLVTRSWPGWAWDVVLSTAITAGITGIGLAALLALRRRFPRGWWLATAIGGVAVAGAWYVVVTPVVVDPLFNRFEEVRPGPLREDVVALARRAGVDVGNVLIMDASRRTIASNAYVAGLGATKRVVLYDNLVERFPPEEVRLVIAHELAHVHHDDVRNGLLYALIVAPFGLLAVALLTDRLAPSGPRGRGPAAVPALALSLALVATPVTWVSNQLSRDVEARADAFALELTGEPDVHVRSKVRAALRNVSDPDPPAFPRLLLGTHPTTVERIGIAEAFRRERAATATRDAARTSVQVP